MLYVKPFFQRRNIQSNIFQMSHQKIIRTIRVLPILFDRCCFALELQCIIYWKMKITSELYKQMNLYTVWQATLMNLQPVISFVWQPKWTGSSVSLIFYHFCVFVLNLYSIFNFRLQLCHSSFGFSIEESNVVLCVNNFGVFTF